MSPLRRMIKELPDSCLNVFDRCITKGTTPERVKVILQSTPVYGKKYQLYRLKDLLGTQIHENKKKFLKNFDFRLAPVVNIPGGSPLGKNFKKKFFFKVVPNDLKRRENSKKIFKKFFSQRPGQVENQIFSKKNFYFRVFGYLIGLLNNRAGNFFHIPGLTVKSP